MGSHVEQPSGVCWQDHGAALAFRACLSDPQCFENPAARLGAATEEATSQPPLGPGVEEYIRPPLHAVLFVGERDRRAAPDPQKLAIRTSMRQNNFPFYTPARSIRPVA